MFANCKSTLFLISRGVEHQNICHITKIGLTIISITFAWHQQRDKITLLYYQIFKQSILV